MEHQETVQPIEFGSLRSYVVGFVLSVLLTLGAYFFVAEKVLVGLRGDLVVGLFAVVQALVQLIFFLNLTREPKPRWNLVVFLFMVLIVVLIVFGTIWILNNLNYNLMNT